MNLSDKQWLRKFHADLCGELGITPTTIVFDNTINAFGKYNSRTNIIQINLKMIEDFGHIPEGTIAHETWHHYQFSKGWLTAKYWKGKRKKPIKRKTQWNHRPWERGAIRYAKKIIRQMGLSY